MLSPDVCVWARDELILICRFARGAQKGERMLRPKTFQEAHVAFRNIPYALNNGASEGNPQSGGVLSRGQTVWTRECFALGTCPESTTAFVDGVGLVALDPRWLVRADALQPTEIRAPQLGR